MHIAFVTETHPPEINGVALTVERSIRHLRDRGHRVEVIRPRQPGESARCDASEWRTAGMPIPMYPDLRIGWATVGALRQRFAGDPPQLVHVATQGPLGRAALKAACALGIPVTTDFRTNFHWYSRYYRLGWFAPVVWRYLRAFHNQASRTFAPTPGMRDALTEEGIERVEVVGRGIDADRFSPQRRRAALRAQWGVQDDAERVLLYLGRLAAEKKVEVALASFEAARRTRPGLRMVVVGDGPLRAELQHRHPDVLFAGMQRGEALAEHVASADIFAFPSESETFGNVTTEALASGLAVVAVDLAAAHELIRDGENGFVVAPGDAPAFTAAVERALSLDAAAMRTLRDNARTTALGVRWEEVLDHFESRLVAVAGARPQPGPARTALA